MLMTVSSLVEIAKIDAIIARLKKNFELTVEDTKDDEIDVFAYLGVEVK